MKFFDLFFVMDKKTFWYFFKKKKKKINSLFISNGIFKFHFSIDVRVNFKDSKLS